MANPEHVQRLHGSVEAWNAWLAVNPQVRPALANAELAGANLANANLANADLTLAELGAANLADANLASAKLEYGYLASANLECANLEGAKLANAQLQHANLECAKLVDVQLQHANLDRARLWGANLKSANLQRADLQDASLTFADLVGANIELAILQGANLQFAKLDHANLTNANLQRADLACADLQHADLQGAQLQGANLAGSYWGDTLFARAKLKGSQGLDACVHKAPSPIAREILRENPDLAAEFLRGCGLEDWEIEQARLHRPNLKPTDIAEILTRVHDLRAGAPVHVRPIFISYSHRDEEFVDRLGQAFDAKRVRYWRDIKDATSGRLDEVLERGIRLHPTALVVLSEHSTSRPWVEFEIETAVKHGSKLCPIALDSAWLNPNELSGSLRIQLKKYMVLDFSDPNAFGEQFRKLWTGIERHYSAESSG